ncbi:unnamed protein product [Ceratitis capitata]|uniref:(Mediterranean fruit fly) hypothetical protein n=1 Tax=Ceratitis capitata TaxID=7213 RepID=A0A811U7R3_CERCA|nr:unnamed protein product [Ceratitis capitata]
MLNTFRAQPLQPGACLLRPSTVMSRQFSQQQKRLVAKTRCGKLTASNSQSTPHIQINTGKQTNEHRRAILCGTPIQ